MPQPRNSSPLLGSFLVLCLGCSDTAAPVSQSPPPTPQSPPSTPPATSGFIWGQVLKESGPCIRGAMVEIVEGPGIGQKSGQPDNCGPWDYDGFWLNNLPPGATVTLRATASGYQPEDSVVVVPNGGRPVQFVLQPD
jgi:hypothetical protein